MNIMHPVLRRIDLNLLPVFDAVYRSRSVRLAAEELAMSTSALSHALSRLRSALNDPLFYREGHRMCPSVYASQLAPSIASALKFLNQELTPPAAFVPAASTDCMQIAITDFTAFCVFPTLMHHLQREAPGLRFELRYLPHSPALTELPTWPSGSIPLMSQPIPILRRLTGCGTNMWSSARPTGRR